VIHYTFTDCDENRIETWLLEIYVTFTIAIMAFRIGSKQVANGNDYSEVKEWDATVKSISRSRTFGEDTNDPVKIAGYMELLAETVHRALIKDRFLFKVVSIEIRYDDFSTYTRAKTVSVWSADLFVIKRNGETEFIIRFNVINKNNKVSTPVSQQVVTKTFNM